MRPLMRILCACIALISAAPAVRAAEAAGVLTNIAQCLEEVRRPAATLSTVQLAATVTLIDTARSLLVLQDNSGAMAIYTSLTNASIRVGSRVMIAGECALPYVRSFPEYPDRPTGREYPTNFEVPLGTGTFYLTRMRGYLHPPATGRYTFWIAADDCGELRLSTNGDPVNARRICEVPPNASTGRREFARSPWQRSRQVELRAGERYYVEALQMQGVGPDCLTIAWEGPGFARTEITGQHLTPWDLSDEVSDFVQGPPTNCILREYWNNYYVRNFFPLNYRSLRESVLRVKHLNITVVGNSVLPEPVGLQPSETPGLSNELRWVKIEGLVTFAAESGGRLRLEIADDKASSTVHVLNWTNWSASILKGTHVEVEGVCENTLDLQRHFAGSALWGPGPEYLRVLTPREKDWSDVSAALISEIEPSNPAMTWGHRFKVRGRVARQDSELSLLLQGNDVFEGYTSPDATNWVQIGKPVEIGMGSEALIGLAVASHQTGQLATATFDSVRAVGTNWFGTDIDAGLPGKFDGQGNVFRVTGSGKRIWAGADQCFFLYRELAGEGEIVGRLADFSSQDRMGQAGLMIRESLERSAVCVAILTTPAHGARVQFRRSRGQPTAQFLPPQEPVTNQWLKLVRRHTSLPVRLAIPSGTHLDQTVEVIGNLAWENGLPVLTAAVCRRADPEVVPPSTVGPLRLRNPSIQEYLAEAQLPSQPYQRGYIDVSGIRGVVTFYDPLFSPNSAYIQDGQSGLPLVWADTNLTTTLRVGQVVDVAGRSIAGQIPVTLEPAATTVMGWGQMPEPTDYSGDTLTSRNRHGQWVQVEGVVRQVSTNNLVRIMCREGVVTARVGRAQQAELQSDINALVRARGVLTLRPGDDPLLLIPSPAFMEIEEAPPTDPFAVPTFAITNLLGLDVKPEHLRQIKVAGVVTCVRSKELFVQDNSGGALVQPAGGPLLVPGDNVEVVGFPSGRGSVVLTEALVRSSGRGRMPRPVMISSDQSDETKYSVGSPGTELEFAL